jgi:hypothetical protein
MNYQIIRRDTAAELEEAVDAFLNQGWTAIGGVAVVSAVSHYQNREDTLCSSTEWIWAQAIQRTRSL